MTVCSKRMTVWITHLVTFANEISLNIKLGTGFNLAMHFYRMHMVFFLHVSQDIRLITNRSVITFFVNNMQNINGGNTVYLQEK